MTAQAITTAPARTTSPLMAFASRLSIDEDAAQALVFNTLMKAKGNNAQVSNEEIVTFLAISNEYRLNPMTKEIYAFNNRGAIQPIVSIDGWLKIINGHPQFDGMEFVDTTEGGKLISVTCKIYRKDRSRPTEVTEYMSECAGTSEPWKKWPARMLRHKAAIQCARYAFGLSGIIDEDEAERYRSTNLERDVTPQRTTSVKALMDSEPANQAKAQPEPEPQTNPFMQAEPEQEPTPLPVLLEALGNCRSRESIDEWKALAGAWPEGTPVHGKLMQAYQAHIATLKTKVAE